MVHDRMRRKTKWLALTLCVAAIAAAPAAYSQSQSTNDLKELRKEVEALKAGQKDMQKTLQVVKDILMGKQPPLEDVFITTNNARSEGDAKAKVIMVEFSDYQCPFCGRYATETYSKIFDDYVKTGKVEYVLRNFPLEQLHPNAEKAAEAAECAGEQGKYWEMHDRLFKNQSLLDAKEMPGHALVLGLNQAEFQQCFDGGKFTAKVKADQADGTKLRVTGTPTFFFGYPDDKDPTKMKAVKMLTGAQPLERFTEILDGLLNPPKEEAVAR
jgi:protein-disulfide isomerase